MEYATAPPHILRGEAAPRRRRLSRWCRGSRQIDRVDQRAFPALLRLVRRFRQAKQEAGRKGAHEKRWRYRPAGTVFGPNIASSVRSGTAHVQRVGNLTSMARPPRQKG